MGSGFFNLDVSKGAVEIGKITIPTDKLEAAVSTLIKVLLVMLLMFLAIKIGNAIINKSVEKQEKLRFSMNEKKAKTIGAILKSILRYAVYFVGIIAMTETLFGKTGSIFAGLGGAAIGFGAQSFIKDVINGFFILFEEQYAVGDYITLEDKSGIVESIELRITRIRDFNGDLHIIPNGSVNTVTNHSRGNMRVIIETAISLEEDVDRAIEAISEACEEFKKNNKDVVEGPKVLGVSGMNQNGISIKVFAKARSMTQWDVEMELRKEIKNYMDKYGLKFAYPRVELVNNTYGKDDADV